MTQPVATKPSKAIVATIGAVLLAVLATVQTAVSDGGIDQQEWFVIIGAFVAAVLTGVATYQTTNEPLAQTGHHL